MIKIRSEDINISFIGNQIYRRCTRNGTRVEIDHAAIPPDIIL